MSDRDRWEVLRHVADGITPTKITTHKSVELAERAFETAKADGFYALDVCFLREGKRLEFEPLFGIANGCYWVDYHGPVYADNQLNETCQ